MSKKLALGADCILLDVKYGSGAFMKTQKDAAALARCMVNVGKQAGRKCRAVITDMNAPLGYAVGNALEVAEVIQILRDDFENRLTDLAITLAANMMQLAGMGTRVDCWEKAESALRSGAALEKLRDMIAAQGGDPRVCDDLHHLPQARESRVIAAKSSGYITRIQSEEIGLACLTLGAGRTADNPAIDPGAGVVFRAAVGDPIARGDAICTVYGAKTSHLDEACARIEAAVSIEDIPAPKIPLVSKLVR
jgi:pyrimidine-nucleoside phosphorylase